MASIQVDQTAAAAVAANGGQNVGPVALAEYYTSQGALLHQVDVHHHQHHLIDVDNTATNTLSYNVGDHGDYGQQGVDAILLAAAQTATPSNDEPIRTPSPTNNPMVAFISNQVQERKLQQQQQQQNLSPHNIANLFNTPATNQPSAFNP